MTPPLVIAVAPNGARRGKDDHPALPIAPAELAETAAACRAEGAAMLHLHVRDAEGRHLLDADAYAEASRAVRAAVGDDMIVQITTEAAGRYDRHHQMAVARAARAEAVSLAVREIIPDAAAEPEAADLLAELWRDGVMLQFILYAPEEIARYRDLRRRGVIPGGTVLFVLGRYSSGQQSQPDDLLPFLDAWDGDEPWMLCVFGRRERDCMLAAARAGGHARVGFENNLHLPDGQVAPDNAALVAAVAEGAARLGRPLADAGAARRLLSGQP